MRVHSATLAGGDNNQDRSFVTDHAVIVLDGASAFEAVAAGIRHTAQKLALTAGRSPSSTVSVLRAGPRDVDLYALGDSPIHYGARSADHVLTDDRLSTVAVPERDRYLSRLRAGHGYGTEHQAALVELQRAQRRARNQPGGYWIAETNPRAAQHGHTRTIPASASTWAVLATDGAAEIIDHIGPIWATIAKHSADDLGVLLDRLHRWESRTDPTGAELPRAKQHDDKTIAAVTFDSP